MNDWLELYVPGRVCLFGEHSDWAGMYRRMNASVRPGRVILAGTDQGIYARVRTVPGKLRLRSVMPVGKVVGPFELDMNPQALMKEAESGSVFCYAAGVACWMLAHYAVDGLEIDNYKTELPVKKGLSSSAAICVLVARAFNRAYDLKMTVRGEMEAAYQGELMTPSRCGRMDQGCAFGGGPVYMTFDGERVDAMPIEMRGEIYLLVADLNGKKDTVRILQDLNKCYPFATSDVDELVHAYLGPINEMIVSRARQLIESGDAKGLGSLMDEAQRLFDEYVIPACPSQLKSPLLHEILDSERIRPFIYGGKGVGSQGDGAVQFVARSRQDRDRLAEVLLVDYSMQSYPLDLRTRHVIRKAVIPVAGSGTRMYPASKVVKKELFPVVTPDGLAKPLILAIVEEAIDAGIDQVCLVIRPQDEQVFRSLFERSETTELLQRLPPQARSYADRLSQIAGQVTFVHQTESEGFGDAVLCASEWVGDEPFLLMLGDHLSISDYNGSCTRQLLDSFERHGRALVALRRIPESEVGLYGVVSGHFVDDGRMLEVGEFAEKPSADYARVNLEVDGLPRGSYLGIFGLYALPSQIFTHLRRQRGEGARQRGEFQLTTALESLRREEGCLGLLLRGRALDMGLPTTYVKSLNDYCSRSRAQPD